jgi:GTP:adenosylcobinamide-phosphate guanylyltransferase
MDALILAGGEASPELAEATGCTDRALIPIEGRPMIAHVLAALRSTVAIERIAVAGHEGTLAIATDTLHVPARGRMVDNLTAGLSALESSPVLVCTCDIPLVTAASFEELLAGAAARGLEMAYPVVARATCETTYPAGQRTYATLCRIELTGGNAVLVPGHAIERITRLADAAYNARKKPLELAKILGPGFLIKFLSKRLTVAEIERKAARVLGCRVGAVEMRDAAIAFDVDKLSDLRVAEQVLKQRALEPLR